MAINKVQYGNTTLIDLTDTTAVASDVAQGKYFYGKDGVKTLGTASGGGGSVTQDQDGFIVLPATGGGGGGGSPTLKMGVIRPDAELVQSWSYDKLIVEDEEVAIPSYSTSAQTLKASASLATYDSLDFTSYNYYTTIRALAIPIYTSSTTQYTRQLYFTRVRCYEYVRVPVTEYVGSGYTGSDYYTNTFSSSFSTNIYVVQGRSQIGLSTAGYGGYFGDEGSALSATNGRLTISSPSLKIVGNSSYFSSSAWSELEDIRYQYIIEFWRTPKNSLNIKGYNSYSLFDHVKDCFINGGTLT